MSDRGAGAGLGSRLPIEAAARLAGRPGRVLLHSGEEGDGCGRYSFVAADPEAVVLARGAEVELRRGDEVLRLEGDPLAVVLELACAAGHRREADPEAGPVPVAIGYLAYDLGRVLEPRLTPRPPGAGEPPDLWFGIYRAVWRHDARTGRAEVVGEDPEARARLEALLRAPAPEAEAPRFGPLEATDPEDAYRAAFARLQRYIAAGDVYQVNLARRLRAAIERDGDALALYRALDARSPAAYGALLECAGSGARVISISPERFLRRPPGGGRLETRPIKGTRRRTGSAADDRARAADLAADEKERAEHLMIVDLERNDLGRVAEIGSVRVDSFGRVVELPTLYHMVSTVSCAPRAGVTWADAIRAAFPGGSITGAPKLRAMEIIDELEPFRRGVYTGAIGYLGQGGAFDFSIAIRTAVLGAGALELSVGGGVVADSTADRELAETEEKAAAWRATLAR